jgi:hypothetical protein
MKPILFTLVIAMAAANAADMAGNWRLTGQIADVAIDRACVIQQAGDKIQGVCKNSAGEVALSGQTNDKSVTWKYEALYSGVKVVLVFDGTFESASEIKGKIMASDPDGNFAVNGSFLAKRE